MRNSQSNLLVAGARRVWQRQRVLWWVYLANLVLAGFATAPAAVLFEGVLDRSLAARRLSESFDLAVFMELMNQPGISLGGPASGSLPLSVLFLFFLLFLTGGILADYRTRAKLSTADFFRACGAFFWRFVRLLILLLLVLTPVGIALALLTRWSNRLSSDAAGELTGFWIALSGALLGIGAFMVIRLCFDIAQVHAVATEERAIRKALWRAVKLVSSNFARLFGLFFLITLVGCAMLALIAWIWAAMVPPQATIATFLLGQIAVLIGWGTRLWQRAIETIWYERWQAATSHVSPIPESRNAPQTVS